jgi:hypothetical protein
MSSCSKASSIVLAKASASRAGSKETTVTTGRNLELPAGATAAGAEIGAIVM